MAFTECVKPPNLIPKLFVIKNEGKKWQKALDFSNNILTKFRPKTVLSGFCYQKKEKIKEKL